MARRDLDEWLWQVGTELQRLSEEITPAGPKVARSSRWQPHVDLFETSSFILLKAEIAGVNSDDIRISYYRDRNTLVIRGIRTEQDLAEGHQGAVHQLEIYYGEFEREISLPTDELDVERASAQYRNGFLTIEIPKGAPTQKLITGRLTVTVRKL